MLKLRENRYDWKYDEKEKPALCACSGGLFFHKG